LIEDVNRKIGELNLRPDHEEVIKDTIEEAKVYIHGLGSKLRGVNKTIEGVSPI
jgi:hypothetical protein